MPTPLTRALGIVAVLALLAAPAAFAQQEAPPAPTIDTESFTNAELDSFAEAYLGVETLRMQYQMQYGDVEDPAEMAEIQELFTADATAVIAETGLDAERYDMIIMATQTNPEFAEDVTSRIQRLHEQEEG